HRATECTEEHLEFKTPWLCGQVHISKERTAWRTRYISLSRKRERGSAAAHRPGRDRTRRPRRLDRPRRVLGRMARRVVVVARPRAGWLDDGVDTPAHGRTLGRGASTGGRSP